MAQKFVTEIRPQGFGPFAHAMVYWSADTKEFQARIFDANGLRVGTYCTQQEDSMLDVIRCVLIPLRS